MNQCSACFGIIVYNVDKEGWFCNSCEKIVPRVNNLYRNKCLECGKELKYDIVEDKYEFCICLENEQKIEEKQKENIPPASDQISLANVFENEIQDIAHRYCGQGMTIGSALGALEHIQFKLMLNINMEYILETIKRKL